MSNKDVAREAQDVWDTAKQLEAVETLREYDHAFISPEGVTEICRPFGFMGTTYEATDTSDKDPKGLSLPGGPGSKARGVDAQDLAIEICERFGVSYDSKFGRGSQLRACCDALQHAIEERGWLSV